jgi:hypothetical protein
VRNVECRAIDFFSNLRRHSSALTALSAAAAAVRSTTSAMDDGKFQSTMNSLNYGTVMEAAAKNYMKEKLEEEANARARPRGCVLDARDLAEVCRRRRR